MKKLISSLVLVLVLCLACSIAMADTKTTDTWRWDGTTLYNYVNGVEHVYEISEDPSAVIKWPVESDSALTNGLIRFKCTTHSGEEGGNYTASEFQEFIVFAEHDFPTAEEAIEAGTKDGKITDKTIVKEYKPATCTTDGYIVVYCQHNTDNGIYFDNDIKRFTGNAKACKATKKYELKATGHKWSDEQEPATYITVVAPTCTEAGVLKAYCLNDGCKAERDVPTQAPRGYHEYDWENPLTDQIVTEATCINPWGQKGDVVVCKYCGDKMVNWDSVYDYYDEENHKFGGWLVDADASKDATCTEAGVKSEYRICTLCLDAKEVRETEIAALGHLKVDDKANIKKVTKAATCTEEGEYQIICGRCGKEVLDTQAIKVDLNNHPKGAVEKLYDTLEWENSEWYNRTCVGDYAEYYCTACERNFFEQLTEGEGHDYVADEATSDCWSIHYKCSRCNSETWETREEESHLWSDWVERNAIGEGGNPGYWIRQCERCGRIQERKDWTAPTACDDTSSHNYEVVAEVEPTFLKDGYVVYKCSVCGDSWSMVLPKLTADDFGLVEQFVARCYDKILGRAAEMAEIVDWSAKLSDGEATAADIVIGFINSKEFADSDADTVETLYEAMLNRDTTDDENGYNYWNNYVKAGASNAFLVNGFAGSAEFAALCDEYEIEAGKTEMEIRDANIHATGFVNRCYEVVLNRAGEADGLNYWVENMITGAKDPKEVAYGFVFSKEYDAATKIASEQSCDLVEDLYRLYLGREGSEEEVLWYANLITDGMTLEELNAMFADSQEFAGIVTSFGL